MEITLDFHFAAVINWANQASFRSGKTIVSAHSHVGASQREAASCVFRLGPMGASAVDVLTSLSTLLVPSKTIPEWDMELMARLGIDFADILWEQAA